MKTLLSQGQAITLQMSSLEWLYCNALLIPHWAGAHNFIPVLSPYHHLLSCDFYVLTLRNRSTSPIRPKPSITFYNMLYLKTSFSCHCASCDLPELCYFFSTNLPVTIGSFTSYAMKVLCSFQNVFMFIIKIKLVGLIVFTFQLRKLKLFW